MGTPPHDTASPAPRPHNEPPHRLPYMALIALAMCGFITILTEALPAGVLIFISHDLTISEALAGQLITAYAAGSLLAAIPLTAATQNIRRRPLLLAALLGFAVANTVTALSTSYTLTLAVRFLAGVSAGLLWALLAGYASRMVAKELRGKAIAIAMAGIPIALSIGIPAGTFLGNLVGWRWTFGIISILSILLIAWILRTLPDFEGRPGGRAHTIRSTMAIPGVKSVLFVVLGFVLAHNILYTYIVPFLSLSGLAARADVILLLFGLSALAGIWGVGIKIDRHLRLLTLWSTALFAAVAVALSFWGDLPWAVYGSVVLWGLGYGGASPLFQAALVHTAEDAADIAQSMLVTAWNLAIAIAGFTGGIILEQLGAHAFPPTIIILLSATFVTILTARRHGFPRPPQNACCTEGNH